VPVIWPHNNRFLTGAVRFRIKPGPLINLRPRGLGGCTTIMPNAKNARLGLSVNPSARLIVKCFNTSRILPPRFQRRRGDRVDWQINGRCAHRWPRIGAPARLLWRVAGRQFTVNCTRKDVGCRPGLSRVLLRDCRVGASPSGSRNRCRPHSGHAISALPYVSAGASDSL
jgi:hypothetical protein